MEWKQRKGMLSEREKQEMDDEKREMAEMGMDPNKVPIQFFAPTNQPRDDGPSS